MNPAYIEAIRANATAPTGGIVGKAKFVNGQYVLDEQQSKPQKQKNKGGFLSSLISEASGLGGAGLGGAIGTAILPGVGTAIGAGLGGAIGGFSGRLGENKIRDNEYKLSSALTEGAITGTLSAIGPAFQAFKGARGAKALGGALELTDEAAKTLTKGAETGTATIGAVEKKGLGLTSKAGGYYVGATRPGTEALSPDKVQKYDKLLRQLKIPANDAADLLYSIEPKLNKTYKILDDAVSKSSATIDGKKIGKELIAEIDNMKGLGQAESKIAREQAAKLSGKLTPKQALDAKREFDAAISYVANPDAATQSRQAVSQLFRKRLKNELDLAVPGLEKQNSIAHDLSSIKSFANRAANRVGAESTSAGGGMTSRALSSPTFNTIKSKTGAATQVVGRSLAGTGDQTLQLGRYAKLQAPGALARAIATPAEQVTQPEQTPQIPETQPQYQQYKGVNNMANIQNTGSQKSAYSIQNALADAQQMLGPKESPASYLSYAKALVAANKPDKVAVKAQDAAAAGGQALNIVEQLEQSFAGAGGGQGRLAGSISTLSGKAGLNNKVNVYNDAKLGFLSNVARSLGEKGVITDVDIERIAKLFPSPSSNPEEAQAKWSMIRTIIQNGITKSQEAYAAPQSYQETDQQDPGSLIQQYQGGYK